MEDSLVSSNGSEAHFVGSYINDMRDAVIAAVVSRLHIAFNGAPGYGKTSVAKDLGERMVTKDHFSMVRFKPTTGDSAVYGAVDIPAIMGKRENTFEVDGLPRLYAGKPVSPMTLLFLGDEWPRCNDAIMDVWLDIMDRWEDRVGTMTTGPVCILTSNWLPTGERAEAVMDRIGLTMWVKPDGNLTTRDLAKAQLKAMNSRMTVSGYVPTFEEVQEVWSAQLTDRANEAVLNAIDEIERHARTGLQDQNGKVKRAFTPINPRRLAYWDHLLAKTSVLYRGTADFTEVHPKAMQALQYAWTSKTAEEYDDWRELVSAIADPITSAVEGATQNFLDYCIAHKKDTNFFADGGAVLGRALTTISELGIKEDDARFIHAKETLNGIFRDAIRNIDQI